MTASVGPLDPADLDAAFDLNRLSFASAEERRAAWQDSVRECAERGLAVGAYDGGRLVGMSRLLPLRQWWSGSCVPMAGLASVAVAPELRGRGIGAAVVRASFQAAADAGYPWCGLYPSVPAFYRRLGAESVGEFRTVGFPASELRASAEAGRPLPRRAGPADAAAAAQLAHRAHAAGERGPLRREPAEWAELLAEPDLVAYLACDGAGAPDGLIAFARRHRPGLEGFDVSVRVAVASSAAGHRGIWGLLGAMAPVALDVTATVAADDPVLDRVDAREVDRRRYFGRVLDAPALLAARGVPPGVTLSAGLQVVDPDRPANDGSWRLTVADGAAELERADAGRRPLTVGPGGLAVLLTGAAPLGAARRAGLVEGGSPDRDAAWEAAFGARPGALLDYF